MRLAIANYIEANNKDPMLLKALEVLLPEQYLNTGDCDYIIYGNCDLKNYLTESLLVMQGEADNFAIYITPIIFNTNIRFHVLERSAIKKVDENNKQIKPQYSLKQLSVSKPNTNPTTINLFYKFHCFSILYSKNIGNALEVIRQTHVMQPGKRITTQKSIKCEKCEKNTEGIRFNHLKNVQFCKTCCKAKINQILNQRVRNFIENNFINKECKNFNLKPIYSLLPTNYPRCL